MSRYRWLRPLKAVETMEAFPSLNGRPHAELEKLLHERVVSGEIRVMFIGEIIPKVHIGPYLRCYADAYGKEQGEYTLPPDLDLNYDDLCAVFDRPNIDTRKRGRPPREPSTWSEDRILAYEMHRMLAGHPNHQQASSAAEAARMLVQSGRVSGAGTPESKAKRLEREFRKYFSS